MNLQPLEYSASSQSFKYDGSHQHLSGASGRRTARQVCSRGGDAVHLTTGRHRHTDQRGSAVHSRSPGGSGCRPPTATLKRSATKVTTASSNGLPGRSARLPAGRLDRPELELVGLYVYGSERRGRRGTIGRYPETGVRATRNINEILALDADVVMPHRPPPVPYETHDADIVALLRSGKNVITTAGDHYPQAPRPERRHLRAGRLDGGPPSTASA